jgi:hypothetical protein
MKSGHLSNFETTMLQYMLEYFKGILEQTRLRIALQIFTLICQRASFFEIQHFLFKIEYAFKNELGCKL